MLDRTSPSDDRLAGGPLPASGVGAAQGPGPAPPAITSAGGGFPAANAGAVSGAAGEQATEAGGLGGTLPGLAWIHHGTARLEGWGAGRWISVLRWVRKGLVLVLGASVVLVGLVMLVTPGPAFLVIPAGLAILATEFYWARRLLLRLRARASQALQGQSTTTQPPSPQPQVVPSPASSRVPAAASLPVLAPVASQGANPAESAMGDVPQRAGGA